MDGRVTMECLSCSQSSTILLEGKLPRAAMGVGETVRRPLLEDASVISGRVLEWGPWHLGGGGETVTQAVGNEKTLLAWLPGLAVPFHSAPMTEKDDSGPVSPQQTAGAHSGGGRRGQDAAVTAAEERSLGVTVGEVTMKPVGPQEKGKVGGSRVDGMPVTSVHLSHHTGPSSG